MERLTLVTKNTGGYELLDTGRGEKLERFGEIVLARPDPQALWEKTLGENEWAKALGVYSRESKEGRGKWLGNIPKEWQIEFGGLQFLVKPTSFKHTGLFPEQLSNWEWMVATLKCASKQPSVLNLFGYTGGATLAVAQAGANVCHVDASKTAVAWARENATLSGLAEKPIRWIIEDVLLFMKREIKRGVKYDAIIMDPPSFGRGPKDEVWKIEESFLELIHLCAGLLSDNPLFVLINGYAAGYSSLAFAYNLEQFGQKFGGKIEHGELAIAQSNSERLLPCGIFARWSK